MLSLYSDIYIHVSIVLFLQTSGYSFVINLHCIVTRNIDISTEYFSAAFDLLG